MHIGWFDGVLKFSFLFLPAARITRKRDYLPNQQQSHIILYPEPDSWELWLRQSALLICTLSLLTLEWLCVIEALYIVGLGLRNNHSVWSHLHLGPKPDTLAEPTTSGATVTSRINLYSRLRHKAIILNTVTSISGNARAYMPQKLGPSTISESLILLTNRISTAYIADVEDSDNDSSP